MFAFSAQGLTTLLNLETEIATPTGVKPAGIAVAAKRARAVVPHKLKCTASAAGAAPVQPVRTGIYFGSTAEKETQSEVAVSCSLQFSELANWLEPQSPVALKVAGIFQATFQSFRARLQKFCADTEAATADGASFQQKLKCVAQTEPVTAPRMRLSMPCAP